jgi:hypothetical protein
LGIDVVTAGVRTTVARLARQQYGGRLGPLSLSGIGRPATRPIPPRSFDPGRIADLEYQAWTGYYLRDWPQVLTAVVKLVREGFGMDWYRTLHGAWLMMRAAQLWAPVPDNDPDGARACMRRFYALVRLSYGEPASPVEAARLEIDWWRAHREVQYSLAPAGTDDDLVESVTRLYSYLYAEPPTKVRSAAVGRVRAMHLSDRWVREGCQPDSPLLPQLRAALVRCYATLLAAVHR